MNRIKSSLVLFLLIGLLAAPLTGSAEKPSAMPTHPLPTTLTVGNARNITQLAMLGKGWPIRAIWSPDMKTFAVASSTGVWLYATKNLNRGTIFLQGYTDILYNPDSKSYALVANDDHIELRDAATGKTLAWLEGHNGPVYNLAFSPDGSTLVTAADDNTIRVWDTKTGQPLNAFENLSNVTFSPDVSLFVAVRTDSNEVVIGHTQTGKQQTVPGTDVYGCQTAAISPDDTILACPGEYALNLFDTHTGQQRASLTIRLHDISSIDFSPDSAQVAAAGGESIFDASPANPEQAILVFEARSGKQLLALHGHEQLVTGALFSPKGDFIASSSYDDYTARLWDTHTGQQLARIDDEGIIGLTFSPDGRYFAAWGSKVVVWNLVTNQEQVVLDDYSERAVYRGMGIYPPCNPTLRFTADGKLLASADSWNTARLWDVKAGRQLSVIHVDDWVTTMDVSLPGSLVISGQLGTVEFWNSTAKRDINLVGYVNRIFQRSSAAFSPDGTLLAYIDADNTIKLLNLITGQKRLIGGDAGDYQLTSLAFSPDGTSLAVAGDNGLSLWTIALIPPQPTILEGDNSLVPDQEIGNFAFSPDGKLLAEWSAMGLWSDIGPLRVLDIATKQPILNLPDANVFDAATFSPDSTQIAWTASDNSVHIWDIKAGTERTTLRDSPDTSNINLDNALWVSDGCKTRMPAFSPDGRLLASVGRDGLIQLWNTATSELLVVLPIQQGQGSYISGLTFSPDGTTLASVSEDGVVRLWGISQQ